MRRRSTKVVPKSISGGPGGIHCACCRFNLSKQAARRHFNRGVRRFVVSLHETMGTLNAADRLVAYLIRRHLGN